ncbi:hypothetical protein GCM10025868_26300 [Angustibacter aerolatus]|uniref:Uncharacterized protein n=1 Tax=Angustibacter aerolatus TaxID=1162965 RepID=A0ABQ6JJH3_9ACTN|nr:hypothetical protein GCM10025868_26300 [Angustibacter aerolatus]
MPLDRSRAIDIALTMPAAAPKPSTKRSAISVSTLGATAHAIAATTNPASPMSSGRRRPTASLSGPSTTWPMARPASVAVSVRAVTDAVAPRSSAIVGRLGR